MIDEGDCGVTGGMKIGGGNRSTRRKPLLIKSNILTVSCDVNETYVKY
jgi:hypothetical protein